MNWRLSKPIISIIALIFILTFAYWLNNSGQAVIAGNKCILKSDNCTLMVNDKLVSIEFASMPVLIEEMTEVQIRHPSEWALKSAWIEGVNMFMGKINVFIEDSRIEMSQKQHNANFFLGSCSRPDMTWKMVLEIKQEGKAVPIFLEFHFATSI